MNTFRETLQVAEFDVESVTTLLGVALVTPDQIFISLKTIRVADGDFDAALPLFTVSHNLYRFGILSSDLIEATPPSASVQDEFRKMYHISPAVPCEHAVILLARLVQISLRVLGALPVHVSIDGFLCDETIQACQKALGISSMNETESKEFILLPSQVVLLLSRVQAAWNAIHLMMKQEGDLPSSNPFSDVNSYKSTLEHVQVRP